MASSQPEARPSKGSRSTLTLVLVVVALLVAIGALVVILTRGDDEAPDAQATATTTVEPTATSEPEVTPTPEPEETTEPEETAEPEPAPILLTGEGIGSVALDTPDAQAALEALFGAPPTTTSPGSTECGGPDDVTMLTWGDLDVTLSSGALFGWFVDSNALPDGTRVGSGIEIGDPYSEVAALPGAVSEYDDSFGRYFAGADDVTYWSNDELDMARATVTGIAARPVLCD